MLGITIVGNLKEHPEQGLCAGLNVEGVCPMWASPPPDTIVMSRDFGNGANSHRFVLFGVGICRTREIHGYKHGLG